VTDETVITIKVGTVRISRLTKAMQHFSTKILPCRADSVTPRQ
jgi:hypothetical protein